MTYYPDDPNLFLPEDIASPAFEQIASELQAPSSSSTPPTATISRKRKKSKMHECEICLKSFPRPSGLQTHMNSHNKEKPYPCEVPDCTRTFAVRSNAKRHLRTHGIIPVPTHPPVEQPYVVDFSEPVLMPPPLPLDMAGPSALPLMARFADDAEAEDGQLDDIELYALAGRDPTPASDSGGRIDAYPTSAPPFKLRWIRPSATSRRNSAVPLGEMVSASASSSPSSSALALHSTSADLDLDVDMDADMDLE